MELKDLILQTLDEVAKDPNKLDESVSTTPQASQQLGDVDSSAPSQQPANPTKPTTKPTAKPALPKTSIESSPIKDGKIIAPNAQDFGLGQDSVAYLENLREKLLVLFEGLKMPELQDTQNKLDLVVRFLQYQLCVIDDILHKK